MAVHGITFSYFDMLLHFGKNIKKYRNDQQDGFVELKIVWGNGFSLTDLTLNMGNPFVPL